MCTLTACFSRYLIFVFLFGLIIYQFRAPGSQFIASISWRFPFFAVTSSVYLFCRAHAHYIPALIFALFASFMATYIYYIVRRHPILTTSPSYASSILVCFPFSLLHAWTTVLFLLSLFEAFGPSPSTHPAEIWTHVLVFLSLFFLSSLGLTYALSSPTSDLTGTAVLSWVLFAIFARQTTARDAFVHWCSLAFALISLGWIGLSAWSLGAKWLEERRAGDEERAPLIEP